MKKYLILIFAQLSGLAAMAQHVETLQRGKAVSFRGLSVVTDSVAWASGSKGTVAITNDGGKTWDWKQVKGFEKSDFRDIEAFSSTEAIIMSSGTPALILKTTDGGQTWQEKYRNTDTAYFFDAMDFDAVGNNGYILGDPIKGKFILLETKDDGETWHPFQNLPDALPGEAAFAASGTCLRVDNGTISIVTGGTYTRELLFLEDKWTYRDLFVKHGKSSQGAFSVSGSGGPPEVIVGGDYAKPALQDSAVQYKYYDGTMNAGPKIGLAKVQPSGFQSSVENIFGQTFLSTGTSGSNITTDYGVTWLKIDDGSYNVCRKAKEGKLVLLAGDHGRIGIFRPK